MARRTERSGVGLHFMRCARTSTVLTTGTSAVPPARRNRKQAGQEIHMEEYKCAFSNTLVTSQFGCEKGEQVTRRGGPDVVCSSDEAHQQCENLFQRMKQVALPAFGVEDDLL